MGDYLNPITQETPTSVITRESDKAYNYMLRAEAAAQRAEVAGDGLDAEVQSAVTACTAATTAANTASTTAQSLINAAEASSDQAAASALAASASATSAAASATAADSNADAAQASATASAASAVQASNHADSALSYSGSAASSAADADESADLAAARALTAVAAAADAETAKTQAQGFTSAAQTAANQAQLAALAAAGAQGDLTDYIDELTSAAATAETHADSAADSADDAANYAASAEAASNAADETLDEIEELKADIDEAVESGFQSYVDACVLAKTGAQSAMSNAEEYATDAHDSELAAAASATAAATSASAANESATSASTSAATATAKAALAETYRIAAGNAEERVKAAAKNMLENAGLVAAGRRFNTYGAYNPDSTIPWFNYISLNGYDCVTSNVEGFASITFSNPNALDTDHKLLFLYDATSSSDAMLSYYTIPAQDTPWTVPVPTGAKRVAFTVPNTLANADIGMTSNAIVPYVNSTLDQLSSANTAATTATTKAAEASASATAAATSASNAASSATAAATSASDAATYATSTSTARNGAVAAASQAAASATTASNAATRAETAAASAVGAPNSLQIDKTDVTRPMYVDEATVHFGGTAHVKEYKFAAAANDTKMDYMEGVLPNIWTEVHTAIAAVEADPTKSFTYVYDMDSDNAVQVASASNRNYFNENRATQHYVWYVTYYSSILQNSDNTISNFNVSSYSGYNLDGLKYFGRLNHYSPADVLNNRSAVGGYNEASYANDIASIPGFVVSADSNKLTITIDATTASLLSTYLTTRLGDNYSIINQMYIVCTDTYSYSAYLTTGSSTNTYTYYSNDGNYTQYSIPYPYLSYVSAQQYHRPAVTGITIPAHYEEHTQTITNGYRINLNESVYKGSSDITTVDVTNYKDQEKEFERQVYGFTTDGKPIIVEDQRVHAYGSLPLVLRSSGRGASPYRNITGTFGIGTAADFDYAYSESDVDRAATNCYPYLTSGSVDSCAKYTQVSSIVYDSSHAVDGYTGTYSKEFCSPNSSNDYDLSCVKSKKNIKFGDFTTSSLDSGNTQSSICERTYNNNNYGGVVKHYDPNNMTTNRDFADELVMFLQNQTACLYKASTGVGQYGPKEIEWHPGAVVVNNTEYTYSLTIAPLQTDKENVTAGYEGVYAVPGKESASNQRVYHSTSDYMNKVFDNDTRIAVATAINNAPSRTGSNATISTRRNLGFTEYVANSTQPMQPTGAAAPSDIEGFGLISYRTGSFPVDNSGDSYWNSDIITERQPYTIKLNGRFDYPTTSGSSMTLSGKYSVPYMFRNTLATDGSDISSNAKRVNPVGAARTASELPEIFRQIRYPGASGTSPYCWEMINPSHRAVKCDILDVFAMARSHNGTGCSYIQLVGTGVAEAGVVQTVTQDSTDYSVYTPVQKRRVAYRSFMATTKEDIGTVSNVFNTKRLNHLETSFLITGQHHRLGDYNAHQVKALQYDSPGYESGSSTYLDDYKYTRMYDRIDATDGNVRGLTFGEGLDDSAPYRIVITAALGTHIVQLNQWVSNTYDVLTLTFTGYDELGNQMDCFAFPCNYDSSLTNTEVYNMSWVTDTDNALYGTAKSMLTTGTTSKVVRSVFSLGTDSETYAANATALHATNGAFDMSGYSNGYTGNNVHLGVGTYELETSVTRTASNTSNCMMTGALYVGKSDYTWDSTNSTVTGSKVTVGSRSTGNNNNSDKGPDTLTSKFTFTITEEDDYYLNYMASITFTSNAAAVSASTAGADNALAYTASITGANFKLTRIG